MSAGRPLHFLAAVFGGWTGLRILMLWAETGSLPQAIRAVVPLPVAAQAAAIASPVAHAIAPAHHALATTRTLPIAGRSTRAVAAPGPDPARIQFALLAMARLGAPVVETPLSALALSPDTFTGVLVPPPPRPRAARWSVSAWAIARGGRGLGASPDAPQLGGAQAGVRIDYAFTDALAATGRVAAPAAGAGREAALGIAWRPAGVPLRFVAERRFALDGTEGGPAIGVSGGVSDVPVGDLQLESFGQAGAIWRERIDPYADGSARLTRVIARPLGVALDAGGGAWAGAQRGVARLDVGPSLGARIPIATGAMRLSLDWRQRVAGDARPGSGPALTLGADF